MAVFSQALLFTTPATADLFTFKDGRVVSGRVVEGPTKTTVGNISADTWRVEVDDGIQMVILSTDLAPGGYEPLSDPRRYFEENARKVPTTLEDLQKLLQFCSKNGMKDVADAICEWRVDLAPNDSAIRHAADYKEDANGVWRREEEIYILQRGMVRMRGGRWIYPERLVIEQAEKDRKDQIALATKDIVRWHNTVTSRYAKPSSKQYQDALLNLRQIDDPLATGKVAELLKETDTAVELRLIYVETLGRLENAAAAAALAHSAVTDPAPQVRSACRDTLRVYPSGFSTPILVGYLGNPDNGLVNRAADTLAQLNADGVVLPLINSLITTHTIVPTGSDMNVSSNGGLTTGGNKPIKVKLENPSVRAALTQLTGQAFGYNYDQWMGWYAAVNAPPEPDLRRDWP